MGKNAGLYIIIFLVFKSAFAFDKEFRRLPIIIYDSVPDVKTILIRRLETIEEIINKIRCYGFDTNQILLIRGKAIKLRRNKTAERAGLWDLGKHDTVVAVSESKTFHIINGDSNFTVNNIYRNTPLSWFYDSIKEKLKFAKVKLFLDGIEIRINQRSKEIKVIDIDNLWQKAEVSVEIKEF